MYKVKLQCKQCFHEENKTVEANYYAKECPRCKELLTEINRWALQK